SSIETTQVDVEAKKENSRSWWITLAACMVFVSGIIGGISMIPKEVPPPEEEEVEEQVVQIIKPKPKPVVSQNNMNVANVPTATSRNAPNVKRMGALAVLGSLKTGTQRGGVNIGAINT